MISLALTLVLFPLVGAATALLLRLPLPGSRTAGLAFLFLLGLGTQGTALYLLGLVEVPLDAAAMAAIPLLSLIIVALRWRSFEALSNACRERHTIAMMVFALPLVVLLFAASIIPTRDYDGRVTWLPKARAIALEHSIAGPFFHGERGINLHNRYPLLLPLDAATLMRLSNDSRNETARWIYVLIPIAALLVMRDFLRSWFGATGAWTAVLASWLPVLTSIEGGALAAYSDFAVMAFFGIAMLYLIEALTDARALRVVGLFAAFALLAKNEGAVLAVAIVVAAVIVFQWKSLADWLQLVVPIALAEGIVIYWRTLVPPAYDEQYEVLMRTLPQSLHRAPDALLALIRHATDFSQWGWFWIAVAIAIVLCAVRDRSKRFLIPLVTILIALAAYVVALMVTSWSIADLAPVAVNRLLTHLIIPATSILAMSMPSPLSPPRVHRGGERVRVRGDSRPD